MKRIIIRCLLAVALAVSLPLPAMWLTGATAQDEPVNPVLPDLPTFKEAPKNVSRNSDLRSPADDNREGRTRKLLSDYSRTDDEKERAKVLDELTKVVSEQFEHRQESRERELKEVEEHMRKLRELHTRRAKEKDQIVRDRVRQLLRDVDGLGWGDDDRRAPLFPVRQNRQRCAKDRRSGRGDVFRRSPSRPYSMGRTLLSYPSVQFASSPFGGKKCCTTADWQ